jgi:hypothetical protein
MRLDELEKLAADLHFAEINSEEDFRKWAKVMLRVANGEKYERKNVK